MVYSFFLFFIVKNKPIIDELELNSNIDLYYSQFKLKCRVGSEKIEFPIVSYADQFFADTKLKIYDYMSKELKKGKTEDNVLVTTCISKDARIDLSRLIKGVTVDDYFLEFVQNCDTTRALYSPIVIYDHIKNAEQLVF